MSVTASRTIHGHQALAVSGSSLYSAAAAYVVLLVAAHRLTPADYAFFLAFWSILFGAFGVVSGLAGEASRSAFDGEVADRRPPAPDRRAGILRTGVLLGVLVAVLLATSAPGWAPLVLGPHWLLALAAALACASYSGHMTLWGIVSGLRRWRAATLITVLEATARLFALVVVVVVLDGGLVALAVGSAAPAAAWMVLFAVPAVRRHARRRSDVGVRTQLRLDMSAAAASAANAALVVGFPVLVSLTSPRADFLSSAGLLLAISLTRAPLLVPLTSLQGVALTHFLHNRQRGTAALVPVAAAVLAVSAAAAAAAGLVGPALFAFLLDGRYTVGGGVLAALTGSAGLLALLTLTGVCCLALHAHRWYALGWAAATATALAVLLVPGDITLRVVVALGAAPVVGVVVHLVGLRHASNLGGRPSGASAQPAQHQ